MPPVYRAPLLRVRGGQPSTTNILARTQSVTSKTHCRQAQPALRLSVTAAESEEATRCAVEMQNTLKDWNREAAPERRIRIRIGIHVGDVVHKDGKVMGDTVNIAARIEPLAEPGGICLTQQVYDQLRNKMPEPLVKLAPTDLKNISARVEIYRVILDGTQERFTERTSKL